MSTNVKDIDFSPHSSNAMLGAVRDNYSDMLNTAEQAGIKILSDNKCCQLLAWVLNIGGYTEESTHNKKLKTDLWAAAKRLNIDGGELPNQELIPLLKQYHKELDGFVQKKISKPEWLDRMEKYYGLRPYKNS